MNSNEHYANSFSTSVSIYIFLRLSVAFFAAFPFQFLSLSLSLLPPPLFLVENSLHKTLDVNLLEKIEASGVSEACVCVCVCGFACID